MKKIGTLALTLALSASLAAPAFAKEPPLLISPNPNSGSYKTVLTLNGETVDTAGIPTPPAPDMLPLRLIAEGDHGSALWLEEDNQGAFYLSEIRIQVNFADNSIQVEDQSVAGTAQVKDGVTFVPADVLNSLEGFAVTAEGDALTITTPNNDPMVKLAYNIIEQAEMGMGMRADSEMLKDNYQLPVEDFEQIVAFFPMMTSPDTLILGKLTEGADLDAVKAVLETYRQGQEDTFSWYLGQHLPKVKDARTVVSGDYILFLIAGNADQGEALFQAFVEAQK